MLKRIPSQVSLEWNTVPIVMAFCFNATFMEKQLHVSSDRWMKPWDTNHATKDCEYDLAFDEERQKYVGLVGKTCSILAPDCTKNASCILNKCQCNEGFVEQSLRCVQPENGESDYNLHKPIRLFSEFQIIYKVIQTDFHLNLHWRI